MQDEIKKSSKKEFTREKLLQASLELFSEFGFNATSMEMIAKKAEVSKGLSYSHFSSKDEILCELIHFFWKLRKSQYLQIFQSNISPKEKIIKLVETALSFSNEENKELVQLRLLHSILLQPGNLELLTPSLDNLKIDLCGNTDSLSELFISLGIQNPNLECYYFRTLLQGTMIMYLFHENQYPLEEIKEIILSRYI